MPYEYYDSGSAARFSSPKEEIINWFDELMNDQFTIASDVAIIQEETSFASGSYQDVTVRVTTSFNVLTGMKLGDDFKDILFSDRDHVVYMGSLFYFDNNYWIVYNIEKYKNLAIKVMVRRCNNVLRWVDNNGVYHSEYCAIDYPVKRPVESSGTLNPVTPEAFIIIYAQLNDDTNLIRGGQRFLFGNANNWNGVKVFGGGVRNYLNDITTDNTSTKLLMFNAGLDYVNSDVDDLINGIADYYQVVYSFSASPISYEGRSGDTFQINPNLKLNDIPSDSDITFVSSASSIATVNDSGLVTLVSSGSTNIAMYVTDNASASSLIHVAVSASATLGYEIRVLPIVNFIYEKETQIYSIYAYYGGVVQPETFIFTISGSNVPSTKYTFSTLSGNNFSVTNNHMYLEYPLIVSITSGSLIKDIEIDLSGTW